MPKAVDHEQRREQIAQAACGVVASHGFEQATVVRIARAAGYTTGMLPHYFASKQDIILAALRLSLLRIEARLEQAGIDSPGLQLPLQVVAQHTGALDLGLVGVQLPFDELACRPDDQLLFVGECEVHGCNHHSA